MNFTTEENAEIDAYVAKLKKEQRDVSMTFGEWCELNPPSDTDTPIDWFGLKQEWLDDTPLGWYGQTIAEGLLHGDTVDDIAYEILYDQELRVLCKCFVPAYPVTQFEKAFEQRFLNETDIGRSLARHRELGQLH